MKQLIYLDYNCFQRSFDDRNQLKIRLEALSCEDIFVKAEAKKIELVWSFMHEDENLLCPFEERKIEVLRLSALCNVSIAPSGTIRDLAERLQITGNLSAKDAIHLACAVSIGSDYFLTCDEELITRSKRLGIDLPVMNPVDYVRG